MNDYCAKNVGSISKDSLPLFPEDIKCSEKYRKKDVPFCKLSAILDRVTDCYWGM